MEAIELNQIVLAIPGERKRLRNFLAQHELNLEPDLDYTVGVYQDKTLIGTGSLSKRVLKCIAVDEAYKGMGLSNKIVSHLLMVAYDQQQTHLFLYTRPRNVPLFAPLGFYSIYELENTVALLENKPDGLSVYINELRAGFETAERIGAVVVNCNPFTLGHRYLIETAASQADLVHVFVVCEDLSAFPSEVRYRLVQEGVSDLDNVRVHRGGDYLISQATFPSYFLKESHQVVDAHARLDLGIFTDHIAPALGITVRFIGKEPFCPVTSHYNQAMHEQLPQKGIDVVEIDRKQADGDVISASRVRKLVHEGQFDDIRRIVPDSTYQYLVSDAARPVVTRLQE